MAVDYYLKLDQIQGEAADSSFKDQIQIQSWSWGASQVSSVAGSGGSGAGKADLSDFSITTNFDKATPKLFNSIVVGQHIKTGTMSAVKSGAKGKPYLKVDFKEMFVTHLQISASSEVPTISVGFTYNEIKIDYSAQNEDGNLESTGPVTYNLKQNVAS